MLGAGKTNHLEQRNYAGVDQALITLWKQVRHATSRVLGAVVD